jgi:hypothetical protein
MTTTTATTNRHATRSSRWQDRVDGGDWDRIGEEVNEYGGALLPQLLTPGEAARITALYDQHRYFRATINMGRHRFGQGEYRYFARPFPRADPAAEAGAVPAAAADRPRLVEQARPSRAVAGHAGGVAAAVPRGRADQVHADPAEVRAAGLERAARNLYGELVFPLQVVINLSNPGVDHTGGEFLLVEQRPRAQSRGTATLIPHGHGLVFTTRDRPVASKRGWSAAPVRHGVSAIRSGRRYTLALVFHDAA